MPDIGLLQGAPPRRREIVAPVSEASKEEGAVARSGDPAGEIAVKFSAPVERAIQVPVVSEAAMKPAADEVRVVAATLLEKVVEPVVPEEIAAVETSPVATPAAEMPAAGTPPSLIAEAALPAVAPVEAATPGVAESPASMPPSLAAAEPTDSAPASSRGLIDPPPVARAAPPIRWQDLLWLALALLVIIGTGIGTRDPWPADEPRFAAVARDMVATGEWLFPRVGGDLYQDKPPLFFWMLAVRGRSSFRRSSRPPVRCSASTTSAAGWSAARPDWRRRC
jgi:hypothetical protein